jgi:tRNA threonylcarbamoyladenosine biosynthesis protein TsaE
MSIVGKVYPFELNSEKECAALALRFSHSLQSENIKQHILQIWFVADLGSGKTTFIRYLLQSLGFPGKVKSPTYQLCESYNIQIQGKEVSVHHFDLYRMNHDLEWEEAGFKEIMTEPGIVLIEWPEKANNTLPQPDLIFKMQYQSEHVRSGTIEAYSELGKKILHSFN